MGALSGVKILDLTRLLPGPLATQILADLGAQVDRVEDTGAGDYMRFTAPLAPDGQGIGYHVLNRGKRSLALDLKHAGGAAVLKRLSHHYDVVFEQFRPGVMDRLGVGHQALLAENPRLVVCALTGYGQTGPLRDRAGHDLNYLARAGVLGLMGPPGGPPQIPSFQLADVSGGMWCVIAILAALRERDQTGRGQVLDVSMVESVIPFATVALSRLFGGETPSPGGELLTGGIAPYRTYATRDGQAMSLGSLEPKFLMAFLRGAGIDADSSSLVPGEHQGALQARFAEVFASRTRAEWEALADQLDCCLEPVLRPDEILGDAHLQARGVFVEAEAGGGRFPQYRSPVTPRDLVPAPAPRQGEHGEAILAEAGFTGAEIAALKGAGVVR